MTKKPIKKPKKKEDSQSLYLAYEKGKKDERERIFALLKEYESKGFELQTAIYSALVEPLEEQVKVAIHRNKASLERKKRILLADGVELEQNLSKEQEDSLKHLYSDSMKVAFGVYSSTQPMKDEPKKSIISRIKWMLQQLRP